MTMHGLKDKKYSKVMWNWEGGKYLVLRPVGHGQGDARWHIHGMNVDGGAVHQPKFPGQSARL